MVAMSALYVLLLSVFSLLYIPGACLPDSNLLQFYHMATCHTRPRTSLTAVFPQLYFHMFGQRKKQLHPARPKAPVSEEGIQFPRGAKGDRSTTAAGQVSIPPFAFVTFT